MRARSASGSVDSPSAVEPTRSQKRIVTTLRCSCMGVDVVSAVPQALQKRASSAFSRPQLGHVGMARSLRANALELGELDVREDRGGDLGIEAAGSDLANRGRAGGDGEAKRLVG